MVGPIRIDHFDCIATVGECEQSVDWHGEHISQARAGDRDIDGGLIQRPSRRGMEQSNIDFDRWARGAGSGRERGRHRPHVRDDTWCRAVVRERHCYPVADFHLGLQCGIELNRDGVPGGASRQQRPWRGLLADGRGDRRYAQGAGLERDSPK